VVVLRALLVRLHYLDFLQLQINVQKTVESRLDEEDYAMLALLERTPH